MRNAVPVDIDAAIALLVTKAANRTEAILLPNAASRRDAERAFSQARAALDAVILHYLRGYAEMKAALERSEAGT